MPDLAEMGGYKHTFKLGPCHQVPGKQWYKCWAKITQEESRKLLTQTWAAEDVPQQEQ